MSEASEREQCKVSSEDFNWIVLDIVCFNLPPTPSPPWGGSMWGQMPALHCTAGRKRSWKNIETNQKHSENCSSQSLSLINIQQCTRKKKRSLSYYWGIVFQKVILIYLHDVPETTATEWSNRPRLFRRKVSLSTPVGPVGLTLIPRMKGPSSSSRLSHWAPRQTTRPSVQLAILSLQALGSESQVSGDLSFNIRLIATNCGLAAAIRVQPVADNEMAEREHGRVETRALPWQTKTGKKKIWLKKKRNKFNIQNCSHHQKHWKLVEELYRFAIDGTNLFYQDDIILDELHDPWNFMRS